MCPLGEQVDRPTLGGAVLGNHQAWSYLYEVNPLNNDYLFFAFPFSQTLDVGDYGKFAGKPLSASLRSPS